MRPFRITLILCAIAALLVAAGCGGGSQPATAQPPTAQPESALPPASPPAAPPTAAQPAAGQPPTATTAPAAGKAVFGSAFQPRKKAVTRARPGRQAGQHAARGAI